MTKRALIMAGGTGGHVFPALAVAAELKKRGFDIEWLGTRAGIEAELVPANGYPLHCINVAGVRGKSAITRIFSPFKIIAAVYQAIKQVKAIAPQVVIGLGGYASGPGGVAARVLAIPLVIHEQNAVAGTTNRILSRMAKRVLQGFPSAFPQGEMTGNPVRDDIAQLAPPQKRGVASHKPMRLLVLGGSLGALAINTLVPQALSLLLNEPDMAEGIEVRHQCGRKHVAVTTAAYKTAGVSVSVEAFIGDMAAAYGWADFIICRAGALTVAELAAAGVGALLIPFPAAIDDHQTKNAQWLVNAGAAKMIQQRDLSPEKLRNILIEMQQPEKMLTLANNARELAVVDASQRVADICEEVMV